MNIQFPEKLRRLFDPSRYKVVVGGRGKGASWGIGRALILLSVMASERIICARDHLNSLADSSHELLKQQISLMGLERAFKITDTYIECRQNDSVFLYKGLRNNPDGLKSFEGATKVWVAEARPVLKRSWEILIPTIRRDGSEIWMDLNPELEEDDTYKMFVKNPPPNAIVIKMSYADNPWFPAVLEEERLRLKETDPDAYMTVWEGHTRQTLTGAVYADEIRKATEEGRITDVPYWSGAGVHVWCDLGWSDCSSLWFGQRVAFQYRMLKSYQNAHKLWAHYLKFIQDTGFQIHTVWLPHDGDAGQVHGKSIAQQTREAGYKCIVIPRTKSVAADINAVRTVFPELWFDEAGTTEGLQALRRYVWDRTQHGMATRAPLHDENSHYADAFRTMAMAMKDGPSLDDRARSVREQLRAPRAVTATTAGWMGR